MEKVITVETMRKSDAYTIANYIDSKKLMYKAGVGVFNSYDYKGNIAIVCGSGNNAGDGYVLSLLLKEKNISYGIITNGKEKTQMNKINSLFPIIDFPIIISEKVGYQKPQKEIFELIQGNDSYYVGDGYEIDMMGAYQAGVKTIWYNHQKQEKDTSFIDFVVYSDEELLEVVKKLNND